MNKELKLIKLNKLVGKKPYFSSLSMFGEVKLSPEVCPHKTPTILSRICISKLYRMNEYRKEVSSMEEY